MLTKGGFISFALALTLIAPVALAAEGEEIAEVDIDNSIYGPDKGDWELTLGGGGVTSQDVDTTDFSLNGSLGYFITEEWEIVLRQGVGFSDTGDSNLFGSTRVAIDYHFDLDRFRPFIGANIGGVYGDAVDDTGAAGLEAGLKFYALEKTFIYGMVEYQFFFEDGDGVDDGFKDGSFTYTIGIGFNF